MREYTFRFLFTLEGQWLPRIRRGFCASVLKELIEEMRLYSVVQVTTPNWEIRKKRLNIFFETAFEMYFLTPLQGPQMLFFSLAHIAPITLPILIDNARAASIFFVRARWRRPKSC
jgi:hypothetical protein